MKKYAQVSLGEICTINPRSKRKENLPENTLVSFVPMSAVDARLGTISVREDRSLTEVSRGFTAFREGDVLFAKITPCMENGKTAMARNLTNGIGRGSTEFHILRPSDQVLGEYIYHFIRQSPFREAARRSFTGTAGQQRVPKQFMETALIPFPSLDEQQRIVDILNRMAHIERLRDRSGDNLRDFSPALFVKMFGNPATNPMNWDVVQIGDLCNMDRQGIQPNDPLTAQLPFVGVENVVSGTGALNFATGSRIGNQKSTAFRFDERHVLYGKLRPYLNKVVTPEFAGRCSTELVPLLPHANVNRSFLAHLLRHRDIVEFVMASVTGTRMPRADMKALLAMPVPLPPLEKQRRFADIVKRVSRTTTAMQSASKTASALRVSLMSRFFESES